MNVRHDLFLDKHYRSATLPRFYMEDPRVQDKDMMNHAGSYLILRNPNL